MLVSGPLGAGKTVLAQGLAQGLGVVGPVTSPTFALIQEYEGRLPFYHMDLYRLGGAGEFTEIGGWDYLEGSGVSLVEWPERLGGDQPALAWTVVLEIVPGGRRLTLKEPAL